MLEEEVNVTLPWQSRLLILSSPFFTVLCSMMMTVLFCQAVELQNCRDDMFAFVSRSVNLQTGALKRFLDSTLFHLQR